MMRLVMERRFRRFCRVNAVQFAKRAPTLESPGY
jgi:hypothetical protein